MPKKNAAKPPTFEPQSPVDALSGHVGEVTGTSVFSPTSNKALAPEAAPPTGLLGLDRRLTDAVRQFTLRTPVFRYVVTAISLSADELVNFPLPLLLGLVWIFVFGPADPTADLAGRKLIRLFSDFGAVCFMEQMLKFVFRRPRPFQPKTKPMYAMPAEWYSFPSGHSMRAVYIAFHLSTPEISPLPHLGVATPPFAWLLAWALSVLVARVALGKHFVGDVLTGGVLGAVVATQSPIPTGDPSVWWRLLWSCIFSAEILSCALLPSMRKLIPAWWGMGLINVGHWATLSLSA